MTDAQAVRIDSAEPLAGTARPQRWLFVDGAQTFGGHEAMLVRWLEELHAQQQVEPLLLARHGSQLADAASAYARVIQLPAQSSGGWRRLVSEIRDVIAFMRLAFTSKPDLCIVAEGCLLAQPSFGLAARLMGLRVVEYVPLVQTSKSMGFRSGPVRDAFVRHVYRRVMHGWITLTREQAEDFVRWAGVTRPVMILPNTVARPIESARAALAERTRNRLRVLVLGRIEAHQKGLDALLDFMSEHPELGERLQVSFVGSGPFETEVRARLDAHPALARWVALQGWSQPSEAFAAHDVLLMASRYEGVPLVMLEAMAMGVPVVGPDLDGIRAFIDPNYVFPRGKLADAFERIERLHDVRSRAETVAWNRRAFERMASSTAFAAAVRTLTGRLMALGQARARSA